MYLNLHSVNFRKFRIKHRDRAAQVPLDLNPSQALVVSRLMEQAARGLPMWAIILKARRVGISTECSFLNVVHCTAFPNAVAMSVAHRAKNVRAMFRDARSGHTTLCYDCGLDPEVLRTAHELRFPHDEGESLYSIATAKTVEGARGLTVTALHLSEAAFYEQAEDAFTALISTVAYRTDTMILIESTANGRVGPGETFYTYWTEAVEGTNQFTPIFISWMMDPASRMDPEFNGVTRGSLDKEEQELVELHGCDLEQISWRRWAIPNRCQGYVDKFHQEYPTTPEEAFISTGDPAFLPGEMKAAESTLRKPKWMGSVDIPKKAEEYV
jgi:hypothetical protein